MVITITMKNVRLRNGVYEFRMVVPADCQDSVGKKEITQSLKTSEDVEAAASAKILTTEWKRKFREIRNASPSALPLLTGKASQTVGDFRKSLNEHMGSNLADFLDDKSDEKLTELSRYYRDCIATVSQNDRTTLELQQELGIKWPLAKQKSHGMTRKLNKVVVDALTRIRATIDDDIGREVSREIDADILEPLPKTSGLKAVSSASSGSESDIGEITKLRVAAKNTAKKNREMIENEVMYLQEWLGGKSDITQFTKADLIDYIQNCLPYSPKNMRKKSEYDGKSLTECVAMVKKNPTKYIPISYRTCENRLVGLISVFNYAKTQLAVIPVNPAMGIEIPKVRISAKVTRSYTGDELDTMWAKLKDFSAVDYKYPERYWVTIIALYHGFRVNEICSLHLKDIYQDEDDVWVMDIKEDGIKKTVKTASSVRIVPVHPFVLDTLDFMGFVEGRNRQGTKGDLLFPNLTYTETQGYAKKMSTWFRQWKKTWLPIECHHKNFHSLRHTFTQQAQNQAKMPDRYSQEITGHSISGVSSVHLGYSGRLKPKDVLVELKKIKYGWE